MKQNTSYDFLQTDSSAFAKFTGVEGSSAPLKLLKILIDRDEIRLHSTLVARLHFHILNYSFSFEPVMCIYYFDTMIF